MGPGVCRSRFVDFQNTVHVERFVQRPRLRRHRSNPTDCARTNEGDRCQSHRAAEKGAVRSGSKSTSMEIGEGDKADPDL